MEDIINEILQTEKKVEELLQKTREEATTHKLNTEKKANEIITKARAQAKVIIQRFVEEARSEAEKLRREAISKAERNSQVSVQKSRVYMDELIQQIVTLILRTEFE